MSQSPSMIMILSVVFLSLIFLERAFPLRRRRASSLQRLFVNFSMMALAVAVAVLLVRPLSLFMLGWTSRHSLGLLHGSLLPGPIRFVAGFLLMDLTFYYWHLANHRLPFLWRFHLVHHIDPDLDVSTGFRFHAGEVALSAFFRGAQVALIAPTTWTFIVYELVFQIVTLFEHSNVRLPIGVERMLNRAVVTPRMHGIHHSQVRCETNSNYSVIFPWWDRLHRTLRLNVAQRKIQIGIPAYASPQDNTLWSDLMLPFRPHRDDWRRSGGEVADRNPREPGENVNILEE